VRPPGTAAAPPPLLGWHDGEEYLNPVYYVVP